MPPSHRSHLATTLFATIVTALVLGAQPGQAGDEVSPTMAAARTPVRQLPRVVVTGRVQAVAPRPVVALPRVVVTVRRALGETRVVQAPVRGDERT